MRDKASLMYYCRNGEGAGHLRRALALAGELAEQFQVTMLVSETLPTGLEVPASVDIVQLPKLDMDPEQRVVGVNRTQALRNRIIERRDIILNRFSRLKPRVVVVEKFPFGQHLLRGEILPMIERARYGVYGESLVVALTDGVIASDRPNREQLEDRSAKLLNKYFDLVIVHSDPVFARLEEFFQPKNTIDTPIYHTGFLVPGPANLVPAAGAGRNGILVSAGDGYCGGPLFRAAVEAQKTLWGTLGLPMRIVCGERLPDAEWQQLQAAGEGVPSLELRRSVPDMRAAIASSNWSVSHCSYNTSINTIGSGTPALFVPCPDGHRLEQIIRAQRLVYWGAGRMLMPHHLNGASLANEIHQLTKFKPRDMYFDFNGIKNAANLISKVVYANSYAPIAVRPSGEKRLH
ncbi:MAG: hypothetical protein OEW35_06870 [Gammaproteobacteria bacterium]|nr:hypothetical protein [Gammaproteobacteria bacterium]MDH4253159.1 hypothetical protein [Gammaproteobacteria bacterium]MDH5308479.1 hypothetical protein [Gammaproteobacteria bacterium]